MATVVSGTKRVYVSWLSKHYTPLIKTPKLKLAHAKLVEAKEKLEDDIKVALHAPDAVRTFTLEARREAARKAGEKVIAGVRSVVTSGLGDALTKIASAERGAGDELRKAAEEHPFAGEIRAKAASMQKHQLESYIRGRITAGDFEAVAPILGAPAFLVGFGSDPAAWEMLRKAYVRARNAAPMDEADQIRKDEQVVRKAWEALPGIVDQLVGR